mmetsp:Transcript_14521/g.45419  ORF Transcript_14521/g.45419 Transcript_14521/m.45419 type:complete len:245 (+) Transcript_14521:3164-3898(+)
MSRPRTSTSSPTCAQVIEPLRVGAWDTVGVSEGNDVGTAVGLGVGAGFGAFVGAFVGAGVLTDGSGVGSGDFCVCGVGFGVGLNDGFGVGTSVGFGTGTGVGISDGAHVANVGATEGTAVLGCGVGSAVGMPVRWCVGLYVGAYDALASRCPNTVGLDVGTRVGAANVGRAVGRYILAPASGAYWHAVYPALISCASAQPTASTARSPYLSFQAASPDLRVVHVPAAAPYFRLQLRAQFPPTAE